MAKKAYDFIKENLRVGLREKMIAWRAGDSITRIDKPTDIGRARNLGYKAKKGFAIVRIKLRRGGHKRSRPNKGRRSKRLSIRKNLKMNYQWIAEQRAAKKFSNLEVLNSYKIGKDGMHYFFEIIMIDPSRPEIKADKNLSWISKPANTKRVFRGLTSAGKKSRGLRSKSRNLKVRPSLTAWGHKGK
ncbi:MAG: 50S ribosomal protein L15e [archaeon]